MRIINLLLLVSLCCLVGAKYLPDESGSKALLRSESSTRHNLDNASESRSNESNDDDDNDDDDDDNDNDSLEQGRLEQITRIERKRAKEQRKLQEKREKEERKRQEHLEKDQRKRKEIEAKFEKERQKLEEKFEKEERKRKEKIEKEERKRIEKLAEENRKQQEKLAKEERKKQENLNKKLETLAKETVTLQNKPIDSEESEEDLDFEDIWKNYIYEKYGLSQTSTDVEKQAAVNRYLQEELSLNASSTKSEYRKAVLKLVQTKLAAQPTASSSQDSFKNYLASHLNAAYIQKLQSEIETRISELDNDTVLLQNVSLPWVPQARYAIEQKKTILTSITQYLSSILPNWITGNNSSSNVDSSNVNTNSNSSSNYGLGQGTDGVSGSNTNGVLTLDDVSTDSNGISSLNVNNAVSTEGSPANQSTGSATASAGSIVPEGSTTNTVPISQNSIYSSSNAGQNEIASSVISTEFDSPSDSTSQSVVSPTITVSNGVATSLISVPTAIDSNVVVSVDSASDNAGGVVDSITSSNSDVSVSSTLIPSSTNENVPASGLTINTTNNSGSPISIPSVIDSNIVVPIDTTSANTDGVIDSISSTNSDASVSIVLIPTSTNVDVPASGVTINTSNNGESSISVPSAIDSNVEVPVDTTSANTNGVIDSNISINSDVSVSSELISTSTNVDIPASGVTINTSNNNQSPISVPSVIDSNIVVPVDTISANTDGVVTSSDLEVSSTLIPSPANENVPASGVTINTSNNNESSMNLPSVIDSNVVVPIEATSANTDGVIDSISSANSDSSVSSVLILTPTNVDVPTSGVTINTFNNSESPISVPSVIDSIVMVPVDTFSTNADGVVTSSDSDVSSTLIPSPANENVPASGVTINNTNNSESPISVTSVIDSNVVVPVDPTSANIDGLVDTVTPSNSDVSASSTLISSPTNVDVPISNVIINTFNNNIGVPDLEGAVSNNVGNNASSTGVMNANGGETASVDVVTESSVSNSIPVLSVIEPAGDVSSGDNNNSNGQSSPDSLNTATTDTTGGETLVENSSGTETSIAGSQTATQSTNNVASIDTVVVNNSHNTGTQETVGIAPVTTSSVDNSANNALSGNDVTDIDSNGTQQGTSVDLPSVDTSVDSTSSPSSVIVSTNVAENTSPSDFIASIIESATATQGTDSVNINTASVNTDSPNNEISTPGVVETISTSTNIIGDSTVNSVISSTSETPISNALDSNSTPILQASVDTSTSSDITVDSLGSTVKSETNSEAASGIVDSTGIEADTLLVSTGDANLSLTDASYPQELITTDNSITDATTTATEIVNKDVVNVIHIDSSINNVLQSITTLQPVINTDIIPTEISATIDGATSADVNVTGEGVVSVAAPFETHVAAIDVAYSSNETTLPEGNNTNTQDTVVAATEVNISETTEGLNLSSNISIAITEATDISTILNDTAAIETDISTNPIGYATSTNVPEAIVAEVVVASETPVTTLNVISPEVETTVGSLNENMNEVTVSEASVTPTDSVSVTVVENNISTEPPVISPIGIDIKVVDVTDIVNDNSNGSTISSINAEPTDVPVSNTPVLNSDAITTSEPDLGIQSVLAGSGTVEKENEINPLIAQDIANIPTAFPEEAGASLLEVTQQ